MCDLRTVLLCLLLLSISFSSANAKSLRDLPIPVQSYILREAVESGVTDPWKILTDEEYNDRIPRSLGSDLNIDGKRDYAVSLCMFSSSTPEFRTNGFACAYGTLITSNQWNGYYFTEISGFIVDSLVGAKPKLIIRERGFDRCQDYMCDVLYELKNDGNSPIPKLLEIKVCEVDTCTFK